MRRQWGTFSKFKKPVVDDIDLDIWNSDELLFDVAKFAIGKGKLSINLIQQFFYLDASRSMYLMDSLVRLGVVARKTDAGYRHTIMTLSRFEEILQCVKKPVVYAGKENSEIKSLSMTEYDERNFCKSYAPPVIYHDNRHLMEHNTANDNVASEDVYSVKKSNGGTNIGSEDSVKSRTASYEIKHEETKFTNTMRSKPFVPRKMWYHDERYKRQYDVLSEDDLWLLSYMDDNKEKGVKFEKLCAGLLQQYGFQDVRLTKDSNDDGADIIATWGGIKYAIQCKFWDKNVGKHAVQEVYGSLPIYGCQTGVVMTNSYFTKEAMSFAKKLNRIREDTIVLYDRNRLLDMIRYASD